MPFAQDPECEPDARPRINQCGPTRALDCEPGVQLGTQVQLSHLLRASIELLKHARGELLAEARKTPGLSRPANVYLIALATFERQLARLLLAAFRNAGAMA